MINGEGSQESSSVLPSSNQCDDFTMSWLDKKLKHVAVEIDPGDRSPASSNYSSCEESEFERYCSANSVMGTPSLCSSLGNHTDFFDSEFGSIKNSGFGEDHGSGYDSDGTANHGFRSAFLFDKRRNNDVTVATGFEFLSGESMEFSKENGDAKNKGEISSRSQNDLDSVLLSDDPSLSCNAVSSRRIHGNSTGFSEYGIRIDGLVDEELKISCNAYKSDYECGGLDEDEELKISWNADKSDSECGGLDEDEEDSSLHSGTEGENRVYLYERKNLSDSKENPLLMNSSVAFGCNDWDEFVQETGEGLDSERNLFATEEIVRDIMLVDGFNSRDIDGSCLVECTSKMHSESEQCLVGNVLAGEDDIQAWKSQAELFSKENVDLVRGSISPQEAYLNSENGDGERELRCICSEELSGSNEVSEKQILVKPEFQSDPLSDITRSQIYSATVETSQGKELGFLCNDKLNAFQLLVENGYSHSNVKRIMKDSVASVDPLEEGTRSQIYSATVEASQGKELGFLCNDKLNGFQLMVENGYSHSNVKGIMKDSVASVDPLEEVLGPDKVKTVDVDESFDEMFHDMEEILLDSGESHGARFTPKHGSQHSHPFRDGSSTASTSGADDVYRETSYLSRIDRVEVVGAKQKKGEVSFGERLVGVKEYTVYRLRVWSGNDQWEVERRYRDFCALYRQLKVLFMDHGWDLPSPWSSVDRESRKIFGNASPDVISERSVLIQECLQSILHMSWPSYGTPNSLIWFLSPQKIISNSSFFSTLAPEKVVGSEKSTLPFHQDTFVEGDSTLGKTISLVVEVQPRKSVKQLLEAQHYLCAGCYRHFDAGKTLMQEFVQTLGWGKPRLCEYTGQLFCTSCHSNDTAVLPARVLQLWDFSMHPISQLAKAYLESIYDQPMLCVSAVNPFLFSKVPSLLHVMGIRKKIGAMLPFVRCSFRRSIQNVLGSRRYLLDNNDFFALRDLVDLSKGAFAALPVMIETISSKILEHITQQCLVCCDMGEPCGARQSCEDPSYLIFPFQEAEAARCSSCGAVFHKPCFRKIGGCPCGPKGHVSRASSELDHQESSSAQGFFSGLLSMSRKDKMSKPRDNPVILMGSLPSSTCL